MTLGSTEQYPKIHIGLYYLPLGVLVFVLSARIIVMHDLKNMATTLTPDY